MVVEGITVAAALRLLADTLVADLKYAAAVVADIRPAQRIPVAETLIPDQHAATHLVP
jgi:hypothetical protein